MNTPIGKRTVRGTVTGYVGRTSWEVFGEVSDPASHCRAAEWLKEVA